MLDQICLPIKNQLERVEEIIGRNVVSSVPLATEVIRYTTVNGGKRIRPAVFLLSAKLTGAAGESLPSVAAAMELIHTASLLHDDVVDDALLRRGQPSARAKWGNQISVLVGDFLWCCATSLVVESAPARLLSVLSRAVMDTTEGELLEITRQNDPNLDRETYLRIIGGKTAALFAACGHGGAVMASVTEDLEQALWGYAHNVGMAFQLADDMLDYTCCDKTMGKFPGTDLKEGRLTLPLIAALEKADADEKKLVRSLLISGNASDVQRSEIFEIINKRGGIDTTLELARSYANKAKSCLSTFKPAIERDALAMLADYVVDRSE